MGRIEVLGDQMAGEMPEPQEHAIEAESGDGADLDFGRQDAPVDRQGRSFDPNLHSINDDGSPRLTTSGYLRVKRGMGGARGASYVAPSVEPPGAMQAGQAIADTIFGVCHMAFGDEWLPRVDATTGINERAAMAMAWGKYLDEKGIDDIPPGIAVVIVTATYALPRFAMPKTRTRIAPAWQRFKMWAGVRWQTWKGRRNNASSTIPE